MKNIGIFAHVDAGKTTLTEQILFQSCTTRVPGSVDAGTAVTDWLPIERDRGISVRSATASFVWNSTEFNLIDTPGHIDFAGEAERSLMVLDGAVLVLSAVEGVQSYSKLLWRAIQNRRLPCLIFLNKIDRAGSHAKELCESLSHELGGYFVPFSMPAREGEDDCDLTILPRYGERLIELLCDVDDATAEQYLNGQKFPQQEQEQLLRSAVAKGKVFPMLCGCAKKGLGVTQLLDAAVQYLPDAECQAELSAVVYQIEHDKSMGKAAHVRMFGGELNNRATVRLVAANDDDTKKIFTKRVETPGPSKERIEKISQIRKYTGGKFVDIGTVHAGDIAAVFGLKSAKVGDVIGIRGDSLDRLRLAEPCYSVKVAPKENQAFSALASALAELAEEEPLIRLLFQKSERELVIRITGKIQLEVISALLKERYGLSAAFSEPSVIYKETPHSEAVGYEAYTMPKPCWAIVRFLFTPLSRGSGVQYDEGNIPHNQLFYKYQAHIKASFFDSLSQGPLGWEVTDFKATLIGGEHHTIHTHPLDFFVATPMAVMNGLSNAGTDLLEPLIRAEITAPEDDLGKVIRDITAMRGEFDSPVISRGSFRIEALLPVAESGDYPIRLAGLTGGKGIFSSEFTGYRVCPPELGKTAKRRGIDPRDRAKWILAARGAIQQDLSYDNETQCYSNQGRGAAE